MELKGSKTEQCLRDAFAGESMARNKYTFFASKAKKDGYVQISNIFEETANNEREHAKIWYKLLEGIGTTEENLETAAAGENYEWNTMYPSFAKIAYEEGFTRIGKLFELVATIEQEHDARYQKLRANIQEDKVFKRNEKKLWHCGNCGFLIEAEEAPVKCPVCEHPQAFFEIFATNY